MNEGRASARRPVLSEPEVLRAMFYVGCPLPNTPPDE
jgi:hypothetical protein